VHPRGWTPATSRCANTALKGRQPEHPLPGCGATHVRDRGQIGKSTLTKNTQIDLQHCSARWLSRASRTATVRRNQCNNCEENEVADGLRTRRVASVVRTRCGPVGSCVIVLPCRRSSSARGDASNFVDSIVPLNNTLPVVAAGTETWVAKLLQRRVPEQGDQVQDQAPVGSARGRASMCAGARGTPPHPRVGNVRTNRPSPRGGQAEPDAVSARRAYPAWPRRLSRPPDAARA